jgi:hypothetical protein
LLVADPEKLRVQGNSNNGSSSNNGGGAKATTNTAAATNGNGSGGGGLRVTENQVAKMMEEDMGTAMQYLQGKGLCLMPISLASAISSATSSASLLPRPPVRPPTAAATSPASANGTAGGDDRHGPSSMTVAGSSREE